MTVRKLLVLVHGCPKVFSMQNPYLRYFENMICSLVSARAWPEMSAMESSKASRLKFGNRGVMGFVPKWLSYSAKVPSLRAPVGSF